MLTPTPAREARGEPRVKAAGVILAIARRPRAPDHAGPVPRPRHGRGRSGAGRGGLRRADVGAGDRACWPAPSPGWCRTRCRRGVIGIGGLAKTIVGFLAGIIGTQFIVAQPLPRFRRVLRGDRCCTRRSSSACTCCSACGTSARPTRRSPGRRSATRSSAWWRSSWSSCCPAPSNAGGWQEPGCAGRRRRRRMTLKARPPDAY